MKKFEITLGETKRKFTLEANTMNEALVFVASEFNEEYFGCSVVCENGYFCCIAAKSYYEEIKDTRSALEIATEQLVNTIKVKNNFCTIHEDFDGITYSFDESTESILKKRGLI